MSKKTAVVTGASSGIGYATCQALLDHGWFVFGTVRSATDATRLQAIFGECFRPLMMDVTNVDEIEHAVHEVGSHLGGHTLSALINNAGIAIVGPLMHLEVNDFRKQLEVNLIGVFQVTNAFLPMLGTAEARVGERGKIINISSVAGKKGTPFSGVYAASKHALEGYSECLRQELMIYGIDVIIIGPGVIDTPIWDKNHQQNVERFASTDYGPALYELMELSAQYVKKGYPAGKVGRRIVQILKSKCPAVRYSIMADRWMNTILFRLLPKRWLDVAIAWRLKLRRKTKSH